MIGENLYHYSGYYYNDKYNKNGFQLDDKIMVYY